jgi:protein-S-isoprenylcysteine O-methyltransferase Ste14
VPLGFAFALFYFWRARPTWRFLVGGALVVLAGVFLRAVAAGHVKKNRELTRSGPYAYVRNPLYLGSIIIALGFALAARDLWISMGILVLFALIYWPVIRGEEEFLREQFADYDEYAVSVPRLLPRSLWFKQFTAGFSRELYLRHREYNALLGAVAMLAALAIKIVWLHRTT